MTVIKRKLIEVALPLEAINRESAREKSIHHGHPSTLHLWWARRPLAACRAVLFAQLVDDPSSHPERFPTERDQAVERRRLFGIIERLIVWENVNDESLLSDAYREIVDSSGGRVPSILDPFAGGGSIPLEAQRLGLDAHASDLNPVSVLINKALIELPSRWSGRPPVFPGASDQRLTWPRATGLAEDVRRYGTWVRDEVEAILRAHYPEIALPDGSEAPVIAWLWARSVRCPNPACGIETPLVNSFNVSSRRGKEAYAVPRVTGGVVEYGVAFGRKSPIAGTVSRAGAQCVSCEGAMPLSYVRAEGIAGRLGAQLISVVAEGSRQRVYLAPNLAHVEAADVPLVQDPPTVELPKKALGFRVQAYGIDSHEKLYTRRQLALLTNLAEMSRRVRQRVIDDGGSGEYGDAIAVYMALLLGRVANRNSSQSFWDPGAGKVQQVFARNAMPMIWVYAEANPFSNSSGNVLGQLEYLVNALAALPAKGQGEAVQRDAASIPFEQIVVSTDPPYYDNVPYADLSDFFYVWHREVLRDVLPDLYSTLVTPKADELIAEPARSGSMELASEFFERGLRRVFAAIARAQDPDFPCTIFYAFKQSETDASGTASTGWETMLQALLDSGLGIVATWPVRTELAGGLRELGRNALASSVVLACRPRLETAEAVSRRAFLSALKSELPRSMRNLQEGSVAPVDLAQAAIGPGMAVFSRYSRVIEADGSKMTVRTALALINQVLDEVLSEQEGDFDAETRFCLKWFSQAGWNEGSSGDADLLSRALNTSVAILERGGVFRAAAGKAQLVEPRNMSTAWNPAEDKEISVWEVAVRVAHALLEEGEPTAIEWLAASASRVDLDSVKELTYLLFSICEKRGWTESALMFNGLGTSWSDLSMRARTTQSGGSSQGELELDRDE